MAPLFGDSLTDRRVTIFEKDVVDVIAAARGSYDAILLDVDNGPNGIVRKANDRLYDVNGLAAAHKALNAGGVLAVWLLVVVVLFFVCLCLCGFVVCVFVVVVL